MKLSIACGAASSSFMLQMAVPGARVKFERRRSIILARNTDRVSGVYEIPQAADTIRDISFVEEVRKTA